VTPASAAAQQQQKSNILFIMGDDIGWMQPSIYHQGLMVIDPNVWSGRALQENFHRVGGYAVLHQCIRPLIGAFCAPGHHGYQRACELISG